MNRDMETRRQGDTATRRGKLCGCQCVSVTLEDLTTARINCPVHGSYYLYRLSEGKWETEDQRRKRLALMRVCEGLRHRVYPPVQQPRQQRHPLLSGLRSRPRSGTGQGSTVRRSRPAPEQPPLSLADLPPAREEGDVMGPMTWTFRRSGLTMLADKAEAFCLTRIRAVRARNYTVELSHCARCERAIELEDAMKKKRLCKCGSGKELEKGKQKCDDCRPGAKRKGSTPPQRSGGTGDASRTGPVITIDLARRPELAMKISQLADQNYRTPELQVLYMLDHAEEKGAA